MVIEAASKALGAHFLTLCLYWNHKHGDQMHGWVSGRASNPLEIELGPTNLSEEILPSSRSTDMLQSQQSTGLDLSHCTPHLHWFNTKNRDLERTGEGDSSHAHQKTHTHKKKKKS